MRNTLLVAGFKLHNLTKERAILLALIALLLASLVAVGVRLPGVTAEAREELISRQRIVALFGGPDDLVPLLTLPPFLSKVSPEGGGAMRGLIPRRWRALTAVNSIDDLWQEYAAGPLSARDLVRFFSFFLPIAGILIGAGIWPQRELATTLRTLPMAGWQLMLGTGLAIVALLAMVFVALYGLTMALFALSPLGLQAEVAIRLAYFYLVSFQYTLIFSFTTLLLVSLISQRTVALSTALVIFILMVAVIPAMTNIGAESPNRFVEMGRRLRGEAVPVNSLVELGRHTPSMLNNFLSSHTTSPMAGLVIGVQLGELIRDTNIPLRSYIGHLRREFVALGTWVLTMLGGAVIAFSIKREGER